MSGLDPLGRTEVVRLILTLKEQVKTVFFSSHILHDVETICDRVGILVKGRLTYLGSLSQLSETPSWVLKLEGNHVETLRERGFPRVSLVGHLTQVELPPNALWEALDTVKGMALPIYALERKRLSLEEIFVREVQSES
mgnify:CR=1 FL=1